MIHLYSEIVDSTEELEDFLYEQLCEDEDTVLVVDFNMAKILSGYFEEEDFTDYYSLSLQSDVNEYFVEKNGDSFFTVEPARNQGKYLSGDTYKLIVMSEFMSKEILEAQNSEKIIVVTNLEDIEKDECETCDTDDCDCETCSVSDSCDEEELEDEEENNDERCSEFDCDDKVCRKCMGYGEESEDLKEEDTYDNDSDEMEDEDIDYEIDSIIDEIYNVMKDNDFSEDVIKFIIGEFLRNEE